MTAEQEARRIVGLPPLNQADTEALVSRIATALAEARREEREECARTAKGAWMTVPEAEDGSLRNADHDMQLCDYIAADIRARGDQ